MRARWLEIALCPALLGALSGAEPSYKELTYEAIRLSRLRDFEGARKQFERILARAIQEKNAREEAAARLGLGEIHNYKAEYAPAGEQLERALTLAQAAGDRPLTGVVYNALGFRAWGMGNLPQARRYYRHALGEFEAAGNLEEKARAIYNLALTAPTPSEKRELIEQGVEAARQAKNPRLEGLCLHSWGDASFAEGDYVGAAAQLEQAAKLLEQAAGPREVAGVLTSLGRVYRAHGYPARAIDYFGRALKLQEKMGDRQGIIQSTGAIANAYGLMGEHRRALDHYQRALELARETRSPGIINQQLASLGYAHLLVGEHSRAVELLEEATRGGLNTAPPYASLSRAYAGLGRDSEALAAAETAVKLCHERPDHDALPAALHQRALVKQKLGRTGEALADTREALRAIEQLRERLVPNDFMKRGFADQYPLLYASAIELLHRSGRAAEALETAEQARARAFLDLLATREEGTGVPALALRGAGETGSLFRPSRGAEPELKSLVSADPVGRAQVAATAARLRSTLLAYWMTPEAVYAWVVRPEGAVEVVRVEVKADRLRELIAESGRTGTSGKPGPRLRGGDVLLLGDLQKRSWRELHRVLIRPVAHLLPQAPGSRLTIVPHGPLFQVSFAALLDEQDRYLVERYTLHYAPAAAMFEFTEKKKRDPSGQRPRYLLVADPVPTPATPEGKPLPPLPGSRREAEAVRRLAPSGAVTLLAGAQAQETKVRSLAHDKTVVHFATHGILRDDRPFESFLALGGGAGAAAGDGRLTAREIYNLDLQADLVVLSACRTGLGKISGDGIAGLTRAFFYAGTPSVMATLWDVADEPTFQLVSEFYRSWQKLRDKSRALRAAQLALLRSLRAGQVKVATPAGTFALPEHPVFWAGFVLVGEP